MEDMPVTTVVAWAELLRYSPYVGTVDLDDVADEAEELADEFDTDEVEEFADLVEATARLA